MADYKFPNVDFSWLGTLPTLTRGASDYQAKKAALADLDSADPASIDRAAARLAQAGQLDEAVKLYAAGTTRRGIYQRSADQANYILNFPKLMEEIRKVQGGGATGAADEYVADTLPRPAVAPAAPARPTAPTKAWPTSEAPTAAPPEQVAAAEAPVQVAGAYQDAEKRAPAVPTPLAPIAPLTGSAPPLPPVRPGERIGAAEPDTGQISPALAPLPPVRPGPQYAGPVPAPTGPEAPAPQAPSAPPGPFDPRFALTPGGLPGPEPVGPAGPDPQSVPPDVRGQLLLQAAARGARPDESAVQKALRLSTLATSPMWRGAPATAVAAVRHMYTDALAQTKLPPEQLSYRADQFQRAVDQEPIQTIQEWRTANKLDIMKYEQTSKYYEEDQKQAKATYSIRDNIDAMREILKDPNFTTGEGTQTRNKILSLVDQTRKSMIDLGIPESELPQLDQLKVMKSAQLGMLFTALSNRVVIASLGGSLGRQISDADRNYYQAANASLKLTAAGNQLILDYYDAAAKQVQEAFKAGEQYRLDKGNAADPVVYNRKVSEYMNDHRLLKNKDGSLTPLGQQMHDEISKPSAGGAATGGKSVQEVLGETPMVQRGMEAARAVGGAIAGAAQTAVPPEAIEEAKQLGSQAYRGLQSAGQAASGFINNPSGFISNLTGGGATAAPGPGPAAAPGPRALAPGSFVPLKTPTGESVMGRLLPNGRAMLRDGTVITLGGQ